MNGIFIIITILSALIAGYIVFLLVWMIKKNEFSIYRRKLREFEESKMRIKENIENERCKFE